MKNKVAYRNVKRQIGNYMIYFVSVTIMLGFLFAMNNLTFSDSMQELATVSDGFQQILFGITVFVCVITALFMGYATSFMVKLRKKEFGMYLTMGMRRKDIQWVFIRETLIMNVLSLLAGSIIGVFFAQLLSVFFSILLNFPIVLMPIYPKGLMVTLMMSVGMFALSCASSVFYLRKVQIIDLLSVSRKEKGERFNRLHVILTVVLALFLGLCVIMEYQAMTCAFNGEKTAVSVMGWLLLLVLSVFLFSMELSRALTGFLLRNRKRIAKGTNIFVLRNISGVMSVNAVMIGVLSTILCGAIGLSCVSFVEKRLTEQYIEKEVPFDVVSELRKQSLITVSEAEAIIEKYATIEERISFPVFRQKERCFQDTYIEHLTVISEESDMTEDFPEGKEDELPEEGDMPVSIADSFVRLSDINMVLEKKGMTPIELSEKEYVLVCSFLYVSDEEDQGAMIDENGYQLRRKEVLQNFPDFINEPAYYVVPDIVVEGMEEYARVYDYVLSSNEYQARSLDEELHVRDGAYIRSYHSLRALIETYYREEAGNLIIGLGYIASVLLFMSMAVMSLKIVSGMEEDKVRFQILNRLGVDHGHLEKTLFWQTGIYFLTPAVCPIVMTPVMAFIFGKIGEEWGMRFRDGAGIAMIVGLAILVIYAMYLMITYEVSKREIIMKQSSKTPIL